MGVTDDKIYLVAFTNELMNVLDIDLDFFQKGAEHFIAKSQNRSSDESIKPWSIKAVRDFLEHKCHLSKKNKIPGYIVDDHHEVLIIWKNLIEKAQIIMPFSVYHVDAHSDLGLGDSSWVHILSDLLHKPLDQRHKYTFEENTKLGCGNYLAYAIANQWIKSLKFINNSSWRYDLHPFYTTPNKNLPYGHHNLTIQLKKIEPELIKNSNLSDFISEISSSEPKVPFELIPVEEFNETEPFDFIFLSKSPPYTKPETDKLIPIILEYIEVKNL